MKSGYELYSEGQEQEELDKLLQQRSIQSRMAERLLQFGKSRRMFFDQEKTIELLEKIKKEGRRPYRLPFGMRFFIKPINQIIEGMDCYIFNGKEEGGSSVSSGSVEKILYLHGGAYVHQPTVFHWSFLDELAAKTKSVIIAPVYPKAPEFNYQDAYSKLLALYEKLLSQEDTQSIVFMGDSAGGGLALALAQHLSEAGKVVPERLILLSPWVDLTLQNPEIAEIEDYDPMLNSSGLIETGKAWGAGTDLRNPLLSPIYGKFPISCELHLFVGTHEIFLPDVRKVYKIAAESGMRTFYYEYPLMNHDFPLYPIPEGKKAVEQIAGILSADRCV